MNGMHSGGIATETKNPLLYFSSQADKLSAFCVREEHPTLCLWFEYLTFPSHTLHPNGSIVSSTLNKSEVKEENKGIFQQMAQIPQLYHCWSKRLTFLHHKIGIKLYANRTSAHIEHSIFSDIKWMVSLFVCFSLWCTALTVNIWCVSQIIICLNSTVTEN